ncbi:SCO6880 family protein [Nocardia wallacei]|uniref:SCO6880 family protein n=1 Tax=Nocardia wallacei TaxID=480035 RepID=UPI0024566067|nr:SCO6880 family protein [Nocardia wallacei]
MAQQKYAGWRRPESTGLVPGLSTFTSVLAVVAAAAVIGLWFFASAPLLSLVVAVSAVLILAPTTIRVRGVSAGDLLLGWLRTLPIRRMEAHIYKTGLFSHIPGGRARLPGYGSPITLTDCFDPDSGDNIGALINVVRHTITVELWVHAHGQDTLPQAIIDGRVAGWGRFLRIAGEHGDIAGLAVVTDTVPETAAAYRAELAARRSARAPAFAHEMVDDRAAELATDTIRLTQRIALTFRYGSGAFADGVASVSRRLPELRQAAAGAGLQADWATSAEIVATTHAAFNPAAQAQLDELMTRDGDTGMRWSDAGPGYSEDNPRYYLHDSGKSLTYRVYDYPVQPVDEQILAKVLRPSHRAPYKRVTLLYRPHRPSDAKQMVDADFRDAFAAVQRRTRGLVDARQQMRYEDLAALRDDLAEGHGLTDVGMLVTVTVAFDQTGRDAVQMLADSGVSSSLKFAPCYFDQGSMFLTALGIGVFPDMDETAGGTDALAA